MMHQIGREPDPAAQIGSREHAELITEGRHPGIRDGLQWLTFSHLPEALRVYSRPFYLAAVEMISEIRTDSPELTTALNGLISAKDSAVRAGIRHDTGRAGSVPRPREVVDPPTFGSAQVPARPDQALPGEQASGCGRWRGLHGCPQYGGAVVNHNEGSPAYRPLRSEEEEGTDGR